MDNKERYLWSLKRRGKGITQQEVADNIGLSMSMVNKFERGHRNLSFEKLELYKRCIENKEIEWEE